MSSSCNLPNRRDGFSLIELIIVVLLVSLIGFLVFSEAIKEQSKKKIIDPTSLPSTLRKSFQGQGDVELFCLNKCKECYILHDKKITAYDGNIELGEDVELYKLDNNNHFVQLDELGRIKDKKICFRYHLYANGSTTQMVLKNREGIYFLPSYFGEPKRVESMDEAKSLWIKEQYDLGDSGSFY